MLLVIAIALGALMAWAGGWLVVAPVQERIGNPPADLGARPIVFASRSGTIVHGWWCPVESSRGTVLLLPGIRANRLSMVGRARFLRKAGYSALLIDLQATGETRGDHITFGLKESLDAAAAVDFMHQAQPASPTIVLGSSLGGAAALLANPPLPVDALILEAVYPTIERATINRLRKYLGPAGEPLAPLLLRQLHWRLGVETSQLRPIDRIAAVRGHVFIINGAKDRNTTPGDARILYERGPPRKELWLVPNAGHVDLHRAAPVEYEARVLAFLNNVRGENRP
jgi:fermentation-respiration switch protein FrsA (DUF1100 family)